MSLLTEEQIADILDILKVCGTTTQARDLEQWNEKQQPAQPLSQFEQKWSKEPIYVQEWDAKKQPIDIQPDWSKAPESAVGAVLSLAWVTKAGNWLLGYNLAEYEKPAPVITPHPHAALMAKYAEVAARRVDPWVEFEMRRNTIPDDRWIKISGSTPHPRWEENMEYRHIGETK